MKKKSIKVNSRLIKGGIQYLRGKVRNSYKYKIKGATNYFFGKYS